MCGKSRRSNLYSFAIFGLIATAGIRADAQSFEPYMKTRSRVIGVQASPLDTYPDLVKRHFPNGVGTRESGVVLELLREKKAQQMLGQVTILPGYGPVRGSVQPQTRPSGSRSTRISDFELTARPVSTDRLIGVDALQLRLAGVDQSGRPVRFTGSIQATLWALEDRHDPKLSIRDPNVMTLPSQAKIRRLAVWMQPVGRDGEPITLNLPQSRPDTDLHWSTNAILHVRLVVPGVGVFEKRQPVKIGTGLNAIDLQALHGSRRRAGR